MAKDDRIQNGILGDINPAPHVKDRIEPTTGGDEDIESMVGVSGGVGTETGGTRNLRTSNGATGTDIGNRPK